ncbi:alpha-1,4-N-acetylglucosaminyltransferase-like [Protopterus annectens]|uniref:alpha-1,4-N-acetylglucosaminyltransferase-like n=1 Tax=Protopterus annectens TaxID=7888 RepID=UPI001CFB1C7B|nr:alpha-1,4-N-acetylglucosaminyltransferase-like [Protopterus annectens]XP_043926385.1 alpha-1,4-N-acetylglucosaminyltransferase-like [Protopterus annectens]XP_043926386.1 alpha-1,4-N-acetylglucosaminyltransferase-like [Protopterus annectens]
MALPKKTKRILTRDAFIFCIIIIIMYKYYQWKEQQFIYEDDDIMPEEEEQPLFPEPGVMFVETTDNLNVSALSVCSIESAARMYPQKPVVYFMKGLNDSKASISTHYKAFDVLKTLSNVYLIPLDYKLLFNHTPLLYWYQKVNPANEIYWIHVISDASRLALLWKYGGIYFDTDVISVRQIPKRNFLAAESSSSSSNGVMGFERHHYFPWKCMKNFVRNYRRNVWGNNGPRLVTHILKIYCDLPDFTKTGDINCHNISVLHPNRFYPIPFAKWEEYFEPVTVMPAFSNSYALHLWNYMNKDKKKTIVADSGSLAEKLFIRYCPLTYKTFVKNIR